MYLRNTLSHLFGRKGIADKSGAELPAGRNCPNEADLLAYIEDRLSVRRRSATENHFAGCDDCRELFSLLARPSEDGAEIHTALTEAEVKAQAANVVSFIEQDELNIKVVDNQDAQAEAKRAGFYLTYPRLAAIALIVCAVAAALVYVITRGPSPQDIAKQALAQAMREGRRTPVRISGGLEYSEYSATRGEGDDNNLQLQRALYKLKDADKETAPPEERHDLARVHLAFNRPENIKQALRILKELEAGGIQSAELFNDLGVAYYEMQLYGEAISSFEKALGKSPNYGEALFNKAMSEERAGRVEEAIQDWHRFISITPDGSWKAEAQHQLAQLQRSLSIQPVESH